MTLEVQLVMLVDGHTHAGQPCQKGAVIQTNVARAERMINTGLAKKVGVAEVDREPEVPVEVEELSVDEAFEDADPDSESDEEGAEEEDI